MSRATARIIGMAIVGISLLIPTREVSAGPPGAGGKFGLGLILVDPTGATGKVWVAEDKAIDFHVGVQGVGRANDVGLYGDFLFHFDIGVDTKYFELPLYVGPGLGLIIDEDQWHCTKFRCYGTDGFLLALMAPFGTSFLFKKFNGEAFIELSLGLVIVPRFYADLDVALGFRYYF